MERGNLECLRAYPWCVVDMFQGGYTSGRESSRLKSKDTMLDRYVLYNPRILGYGLI